MSAEQVSELSGLLTNKSDCLARTPQNLGSPKEEFVCFLVIEVLCLTIQDNDYTKTEGRLRYLFNHVPGFEGVVQKTWSRYGDLFLTRLKHAVSRR